MIVYTGFIFLGGTGDLARKYLWQALFNAYIKYENTEHQEHIFTITTGGLSNVSKGTVKLKVSILLKVNINLKIHSHIKLTPFKDKHPLKI